ncbi:hypothetical protein [Paenibacillus sp. HJGM_3]|uniref:hypothetical protein n=1 Tax=Paenibacillus sp. HJGM_3 TaxID=3379816 RepID=UPI00385AF4A9
MKRLLIFSLFASVLLSACSQSKASALIGDWEAVAADKGRCHDNFSIHKDGTIIYSRTGGQKTTGTYKLVDGDTYRIDYGGAGSDSIELKVEGGQLVTKFGNAGSKACTYTKK